MNVAKQTKGFTIIEVVLVLAIAALIFLMIFVALPALQRGQRDTARKQDVGTIAAALNSYRSNHNGSLPTTTSTDFSKYIDKLSQVDPASVTIQEGSTGNGPDTTDTAYIYLRAKCDSDNKAVAGTTRQAAVITTLEAGSGNVKYCETA